MTKCTGSPIAPRTRFLKCICSYLCLFVCSYVSFRAKAQTHKRPRNLGIGIFFLPISRSIWLENISETIIFYGIRDPTSFYARNLPPTHSNSFVSFPCRNSFCFDEAQAEEKGMEHCSKGLKEGNNNNTDCNNYNLSNGRNSRKNGTINQTPKSSSNMVRVHREILKFMC